MMPARSTSHAVSPVSMLGGAFTPAPLMYASSMLKGPNEGVMSQPGLVLSRLRAKVPKKASNPFSYAIFGTFALSRDNTSLVAVTRYSD
jgi:hypothetical protein